MPRSPVRARGPTFFGDADAAFAATLGRGALCCDEQIPYAAFDVFEDPTWQVILNGERRLGSSFEHQGTVSVVADEELTDSGAVYNPAGKS